MKLLSLLLILFINETALACSVSCPEIPDMFKEADNVFLGKVTKVEEVGINLFRDEPNIEVFFDIEKNWKGSWGNKPLKTIYNKYSCYGYFFQKGKKYIMFIRNGKKLFLCDTHEFTEEAVKKLDSIN